jgi:20S proteasome subunit beta 2
MMLLPSIRNAFLEAKGYKPPSTKKTGTTIAGVMFKVRSGHFSQSNELSRSISSPGSLVIVYMKDGIVLGADTRATEGPIVCDKNCEKIHYIAPNIYCCGAGTSADTENSTGTFANLARPSAVQSPMLCGWCTAALVSSFLNARAQPSSAAS